jgi:lysylphosphatidylglycerol synthetase-like protein (DUF2156 family)
MKKTKLDSEHTFLQFLMMFLTLCSLLVFSLFVKNILWFEKINLVIPIISGVISVLVGVLSFYKHSLEKMKGKSKQKIFLLLAILFFFLGFLTIFSAITGSLSSSTEATISIILVPVLLSLLLGVFLKKEWLYSNLFFWILFSLSLFILSRMFSLQSVFNEKEGFKEYSYIVGLFGYVALLIGFANDVWERLSKKKDAKKSKKK